MKGKKQNRLFSLGCAHWSKGKKKKIYYIIGYVRFRSKKVSEVTNIVSNTPRNTNVF